jgi:hypothetical protein
MADLSAIQNKIILDQQREINTLKTSNRQLESDNTELKKVLAITLRDNLKGSPVVISRERMEEIMPDFAMDQNLSGDLLIRIRRATS